LSIIRSHYCGPYVLFCQLFYWPWSYILLYFIFTILMILFIFLYFYYFYMFSAFSIILNYSSNHWLTIYTSFRTIIFISFLYFILVVNDPPISQWSQLSQYSFKLRTVAPFKSSSIRGNHKPTSRYKTSPSIPTL